MTLIRSPRGHRATRPRARLVIVAALLGLLAPLVVAPAAQAVTPHRRTAKEVRIGIAVRKLINAERAAQGLPRVTPNGHLRIASRRHNAAMAHRNTLSHQLGGEAVFTRRIVVAGYHWRRAGENIASSSRRTRAGVLALERRMYHERAPYNGHRLNILSRGFKHVGVDVYIDHAHHKVWLTTDFAHH